MPCRGGSLYHFYDGLWYDPTGMRTHDLPCERGTRLPLSQPDTVDSVWNGTQHGSYTDIQAIDKHERNTTGVPLPDNLMVWRIGWKIGWRIWERKIARSYAILKNRMGSDGFYMLDSIWWIAYDYLFAQNALRDKYNKNRMRPVGQWERKIGWNRSKHESHQITSFQLH